MTEQIIFDTDEKLNYWNEDNAKNHERSKASSKHSKEKAEETRSHKISEMVDESDENSNASGTDNEIFISADKFCSGKWYKSELEIVRSFFPTYLNPSDMENFEFSREMIKQIKAKLRMHGYNRHFNSIKCKARSDFNEYRENDSLEINQTKKRKRKTNCKEESFELSTFSRKWSKEEIRILKASYPLFFKRGEEVPVISNKISTFIISELKRNGFKRNRLGVTLKMRRLRDELWDNENNDEDDGAGEELELPVEKRVLRRRDQIQIKSENSVDEQDDWSVKENKIFDEFRNDFIRNLQRGLFSHGMHRSVEECLQKVKKQASWPNNQSSSSSSEK